MMNYPVRKGLRAAFHDYRGAEYFVTVCTADRRCYFGDVVNGELRHSPIGIFCEAAIRNLSVRLPGVKVPLFVVMPNHIHMVVNLRHFTGALSVVVGMLKREVTIYARKNSICFGWQRGYHDHIIRGVNDANQINDYILNNPMRWYADSMHPKQE